MQSNFISFSWNYSCKGWSLRVLAFSLLVGLSSGCGESKVDKLGKESVKLWNEIADEVESYEPKNLEPNYQKEAKARLDKINAAIKANQKDLLRLSDAEQELAKTKYADEVKAAKARFDAAMARIVKKQLSNTTRKN